MRLSEQIEKDLLDLEPLDRLERLKDISYFIQSLAALKKAEAETPIDEKDDYADIMKQAMIIKEALKEDELLKTVTGDT